jgi:hypothetical protein
MSSPALLPAFGANQFTGRKKAQDRIADDEVQE